MNLNKETVLKALSEMREASKKRKFVQTIDLVINFKGLDFKKPESKVDVSIKMPYLSSKKGATKSLVFVNDKDFARDIKEKAARVIMVEDIPKITKNEAEKLANEFDTFLAEGSAMLSVAKHLGQILAPKGRMPRLIPPSVSAFENELVSSSTIVKVSNKKGKNMPFVHVVVGKESDEDDKVAENILSAVNAVVAALPGKEQNLSAAQVKLTMGTPVKIGEKAQAETSKVAKK